MYMSFTTGYSIMNLTSEQGLTVLRKFTVPCRNLLVSMLVACASEDTVYLASDLGLMMVFISSCQFRISGIIFSTKKTSNFFFARCEGGELCKLKSDGITMYRSS